MSGGGTCTTSEASLNCYANEIVTWNIGGLAPGQGVTVSMPMGVTNGTASGELIRLDADVIADGATQTLATHTVSVDNDNALTLAVADHKDAVAPGGSLAYSLTYGNRATSNITGTTLTMPLPPGVTFVSASDGGTLNGNVVQWTLGTLLAGQSGRQKVSVTVNNGLADGTTLPVDAAGIAGTSAVTGTELARATAVTRVQSGPELGIFVEMNADPVRTNETLRSEFTVTNRTSAGLTGTVLRARVPTDGVNAFNQAYLSRGGTCTSSEASVNCYADELVTWNIGALAPGQAVTVTMPMTVTNGTASGELIVVDAQVVADGTAQTQTTHTVAVDGDNALTLALDEDKDAVAPGETLTYFLTYGNRSASNVTSTVLEFPIPPGTTLVGSSGGTVIEGGSVVQWNLATLSAGSGGRKTVTLAVNATPPPDLRLAIDGARLAGTSAVTGTERAWATALTRIIAGNPVKLAVSVSPNPVEGNQTLTGTLRVTSAAGTDLTGVILQARVPTDGVNTFNQSVLSGGGTCTSSEASTNCYADERVTWNLGTLTPGQVVTVTMPMIVTNGTASGRLITVDAAVKTDSGAQATSTATALVGTGPFTDTDGDGVFDIFDNCTNASNPDQRDTDGDGYGNRCDPDFDNNLVVNAADLAYMKSHFFGSDPDADLDGSGTVNAGDLAILKSMFFKAPGPSGLTP